MKGNLSGKSLKIEQQEIFTSTSSLLRNSPFCVCHHRHHRYGKLCFFRSVREMPEEHFSNWLLHRFVNILDIAAAGVPMLASYFIYLSSAHTANAMCTFC